MNIHPTALFLPLREPALFYPLALWKEEGQSPSPVGFGAYFERKGPFEELSPGGHPIMPNTLPLLSSPLAVLLSASSVCARIAKEMGFSQPSHLKSGALSRGWRYPVATATFWLQIEAGKDTAACCLFFPEGGSHFPHPANFTLFSFFSHIGHYRVLNRVRIFASMSLLILTYNFHFLEYLSAYGFGIKVMVTS